MRKLRERLSNFPKIMKLARPKQSDSMVPAISTPLLNAHLKRFLWGRRQEAGEKKNSQPGSLIWRVTNRRHQQSKGHNHQYNKKVPISTLLLKMTSLSYLFYLMVNCQFQSNNSYHWVWRTGFSQNITVRLLSVQGHLHILPFSERMKPAIPVCSSSVLALREENQDAPKVTRSYLPITQRRYK